jgi:3-oxoacyl-[acyl-carrier-protein] synthase III
VSEVTMAGSPVPSGRHAPMDLLGLQPTYLGCPYFAPLGVRVSNQELLAHLRGGILPDAALAYMAASGSMHRYLDYDEVPLVATAAHAVTQALALNGLAREDLDAVIYAGMFRDNLEPSTAAFVALELERPRIKTLDVTSACSGMAHAVEVASGWLAANPRIQNIALTSVETPYRYLDWEIGSEEELSSKGAGLTIGAGVSALIVSRTRPSTGIRLWQFVGYDDASVAPICRLPIGGVFTSQSHQLMRPAVESIRQVKKDAAKWMRPSMWVLPHQPFEHVDRLFTKTLQLDVHRVVVTHSLYGNTVASAWVSAYQHLLRVRSAELAQGDPVLIKTMAGGFSSLAIIGELMTPNGAL